MKKFFTVLKRFIPPYKGYLIMNIVFNILSALLNLLAFSVIMPILRILFKIDSKVYFFKPWDFSFDSLESIKEIPSIVMNNASWYISNLVETRGGSFTLIILGLGLIILTLIKVGAIYLALYSMLPIRTGVVRDIRNKINKKITDLPLSFFSEERKGDILARVSGDVNEIEVSIMSSLDMLLKNPILIIIYLTSMLIISWELTLFVFILLPISGYVMGKVGKKLKHETSEGQEQWGLLMSQIEETLSGLRIIKAFNAERKITHRFEQNNEKFRKITMGVQKRYQLAHPMSEFLGTTTIAIVLWYGGSLILSNNSHIDAALFIYYLVIFYSIINPAKELSKSVYSIQKGMASMERVDKILLAKSDIKNPEQPKKLTFKKEIKYEDVWFRYKNDWVLRGINLTIPKGKTVALVGESGSGKSTLVDLLPRFYDIEKGNISIDGINIKEVTMYDLRSYMGNVNQEAILFNDTFLNNIAFGVEHATQEQVEEAARIANAHEFITATDEKYETNIGDRGGKLSGGQRQRISIARAILKNPDILILDEATSALDTESERLVQDALEKLMQNRTTIVIAHRLSTIRNADEICVMRNGEIVERGKHEELLSLNGYYTKLCDMQSF